MKLIQSKYDKLVVAIIALSLLTITLGLVGTFDESGLFWALPGTTFMFVSLAFSACAIFEKKCKKHLFIIGTLLLSLGCFILFVFAILESYSEITFILMIIATIFSSAVLILSCIYLGLCETKRKEAVRIEKTKLANRIPFEQGAIQLIILKDLFYQGILSQKEYDEQKTKLLASMGISVGQYSD